MVAEPVQLVTQMQAARLLKVSRVTIWRWVKKGKLTPTTMLDGKTPLFDLAVIDSVQKQAA